MNHSESDINREYPLVPCVGVGIVIFKDEKFALVKRGHEPAKGIWTVPGGMVEPGETLEQAARREVKEECGLDIRLIQQFDYFEFIQKENFKLKYHFVVLEFLAEWLSGDLSASSDAEQTAWFTTREIQALETTPETRKLIDKAVKIFKNLV